SPDHVCILDPRRPFGDTAALVCDSLAGARAIGIPVIFLAEHSSEDLAIAALRCGCRDYVRESDLETSLPDAVARALGGESVLPSPLFENSENLAGKSA